MNQNSPMFGDLKPFENEHRNSRQNSFEMDLLIRNKINVNVENRQFSNRSNTSGTEKK